MRGRTRDAGPALQVIWMNSLIAFCM
jgi:hypothetical protein